MARPKKKKKKKGSKDTRWKVSLSCIPVLHAVPHSQEPTTVTSFLYILPEAFYSVYIYIRANTYILRVMVHLILLKNPKLGTIISIFQMTKLRRQGSNLPMVMELCCRWDSSTGVPDSRAWAHFAVSPTLPYQHVKFWEGTKSCARETGPKFRSSEMCFSELGCRTVWRRQGQLGGESQQEV